MEKNDKAVTTDEPQINYRGVKAMPFVIGKKRKGRERQSIILKKKNSSYVMFDYQ